MLASGTHLNYFDSDSFVVAAELQTIRAGPHEYISVVSLAVKLWALTVGAYSWAMHAVECSKIRATKSL